MASHSSSDKNLSEKLFSRDKRVIETSATGEKLWELTGIDQLYVFRAQWIPSLYASERSF